MPVPLSQPRTERLDVPMDTFELVALVDVQIKQDNHFWAQATLYRRYYVSHEMEFLRAAKEVGPSPKMAPAVHRAIKELRAKDSHAVFIRTRE